MSSKRSNRQLERSDVCVLWVETAYDGERASIASVHLMDLDGEKYVSRETFADAEVDLATYQVAYTWDMDLVGPCIVADYIERGVTWSPDYRRPVDRLSGLYTGDGQFFSLNAPVAPGRSVSIRGVEALLPLDFDALAETLHPQWVTDLALDVPWPRVYLDVLAAAVLFDDAWSSRKMTQASRAFAKLREAVADFDGLYPAPTGVPESEMLRAAYLPGLCNLGPEAEPFVETGAGCSWDVNSLYPSIMAGERLPVGRPYFHEGAPEDMDGLWIANVVCEGRLGWGVPCFFQKTECGTKVWDDDVSTSCWITSVDYEYLTTYYDFDVWCWNSCFEYEGSVGDLAPYIEPLYEMKSHSDPAMRIVAKQALNTVYGKFATRTLMVEQGLGYELVDSRGDDGPSLVHTDGILKPFKISQRYVNSTYPALAAFVTAYGRRNLVRVANANYDRLLYYDTDSVILLGDEPPRGADVGEMLGQWSQRDAFDRAKFVGPKQYYLDAGPGSTVVMAGLSGDLAPLVHYEDVRPYAVLENRVCRMVPGGAAYVRETYTLKDWSRAASV